jgi:hypothetical protein
MGLGKQNGHNCKVIEHKKIYGVTITRLYGFPNGFQDIRSKKFDQCKNLLQKTTFSEKSSIKNFLKNVKKALSG